MTLVFTQGHRLTGKLDFVSLSAVELHETTQMFMMVDYIWEITVKKSCKNSEYGLSICSTCFLLARHFYSHCSTL